MSLSQRPRIGIHLSITNCPYIAIGKRASRTLFFCCSRRRHHPRIHLDARRGADIAGISQGHAVLRGLGGEIGVGRQLDKADSGVEPDPRIGRKSASAAWTTSALSAPVWRGQISK
jgi:hypothetical protein